jgi:hypothetical protein
MGERDAAQADQLIRALCELRDKTNRQLSWLGEQDFQLEAPLRRDADEAQAQHYPSTTPLLRCKRALASARSTGPRIRSQLGRI